MQAYLNFGLSLGAGLVAERAARPKLDKVAFVIVDRNIIVLHCSSSRSDF
jgi:hypothetical protein